MSNLCNEKTVIDNTNCTGRKMPVQSIILNFRDASKNISQIKPDKLFRASSLTAYQDNNAALIQLRQSGIKTIIDLRAKREVQKNPYSGSFQGEFNCINIPLDPWNQPEWFIEEAKTIYSGLSNAEKAYYFFIKCCRDEIKQVLESISKSEGTIAIHCVAGKDRTGLIVILIGMLLGSSYGELLSDYVESQQDTDEKKFRIFYDYIIDKGGIHEYLYYCGISKDVIDTLKFKLGK